MKFWDSSAIVPLILREPRSNNAIGIYQKDSVMIVWWASKVEIVSALARSERNGLLQNKPVKEAVDRLSIISAAWHEVQPVEFVREHAIRLLRMHDLKAADSLQLAAAIVISEYRTAQMGFVCFDRRLSEAARKEGFVVYFE